MRTKEEAIAAFSPVGKLGVSEQQWLLRTEILFKDLVGELMDLVPEGADRTAGMRKLLEAKMTMTQAISHSKPIGAKPVQTQTAPAPTAEKKNANKKEK